jgi:hypothetical protein
VVSTSIAGRSEIVAFSPLYPREGTAVTIGGEARWASEKIWSCFEMRKFPASTEIKTPFRWALSLVAVITTLLQPHDLLVEYVLFTINTNINLTRS